MDMKSVILALCITGIVAVGALLAFIFLSDDDKVTGPGQVGTDPAVSKPDQQPGPQTGFMERSNLVKKDIKVTVQVRVVDEMDNPVPRAIVRIDRIDNLTSGSARFSEVCTVRTNAGGVGMSPTKIPVGHYRFQAVARGFAPTFVQQPVSEGDGRTFSISLTLSTGLSITGTVFSQAGRDPIAGAQVVAYKELGNEDAGGIEWLFGLLERDKLRKPLAQAQTDANGHYVLGSLNKGEEYAVQVVARQYRPGMKDFVKAGSRNVDFYLGEGIRVEGQVVSTRDGPLNGATVAAFPSTKGRSLREAVAMSMRGSTDTIQTDARGQFVFTTLDAGTYDFVGSAPAHQDEMVTVAISGSGSGGIVIRLQQGQSLAGTVEGPDGVPLEGVSVKVRSQKTITGSVTPLTQKADKEVKTDAQGAFFFDTLSTGKYTLVAVSKEGLASKRIRDISVPSENVQIALGLGGALAGNVTDIDGNPIQGARITVPDVAGEHKESITDADGNYLVEGVSIEHTSRKSVNCNAPGYSRPDSQRVKLIEDKVVEVNFQLALSSRIMGRVVDSAGKPVRNVKVLIELLPGPDNPVHRFLGMDHTKEDGSYLINDVDPAQEVRIKAQHRNYLSTETPTFEIRNGEDLTVPDLELNIGGSIMGTVVDGDGKPLPGIMVQVVAPGEAASRDLLDASTDKTDTAGRFTVQGLKAGTYEILAEDQNYLSGRSAPVELREGANVSGVAIAMQTAQKVAGTVRDTGGRPVAAARITVIDSSAGTREEHGTSDENGRWEVKGLGRDPVAVEVEAKGYGPEKLGMVPTGKEDIEIVLSPLGSVKGKVLDVNGNPITAFSVKPEVISIDSGYEKPREKYQNFSDPAGVFLFEGLPPGSYNLHFHAMGYKGEVYPEVAVRISETAELGKIILQEGGVLQGRVVDGEGRPVAGAVVSVMGGKRHFRNSRGVEAQSSMTTDSAGRFVFNDLKGQSVRLRATKDGFVDVQSDLVNPDKMTEELVLVMGAAGTIFGAVVDQNEQPLSKKRVYLKGVKNNFGTTDSNGRFSFPDVPAGHYILRTMSIAGGQTTEAMVELDLKAGEQVEVILRPN